MRYLVTKRFISGLLRGLEITEETRVQFAPGRVYTPCAGSSAYLVLSCTAI